MGILENLRKRRAARLAPVESARRVVVESTYEEGVFESLADAASTVELATMRALQKQIRAAGFKRALVHGISSPEGSGFVVTYEGRKYRFNIVEGTI